MMLQRLKLAILFIILFQTYVSGDELPYTIQSHNSYGYIDREIMDSFPVVPYPFDRAGTLLSPHNTRCTATFIGKKHLLTAAHCVMKEGLSELERGDYTFEHIHLLDSAPNEVNVYKEYKITKFYFVELKQMRELQDAINHWAIVELDRAIDSPASFMGFTIPNERNTEDPFWFEERNILGYAPQFNDDTLEMTFSRDGCFFDTLLFDNYVAFHNCDAGPRDSGSPIYKCTEEDGQYSRCNVAGLHVGAFVPTGSVEAGYWHAERYTYDYTNIAVTVASFADAFLYIHGLIDKPDNLKIVENLY